MKSGQSSADQRLNTNEDVLERAKRAKEKADREALQEQGDLSRPLLRQMSPWQMVQVLHHQVRALQLQLLQCRLTTRIALHPAEMKTALLTLQLSTVHITIKYCAIEREEGSGQSYKNNKFPPKPKEAVITSCQLAANSATSLAHTRIRGIASDTNVTIKQEITQRMKKGILEPNCTIRM
ncbi:hypothetical protein Cgig2_009447 [Carnegiea gigantea]|uniref:Uncharacterized protein n=1 Tax=Carnegiea gigantea TaxID=171969 RepID=A0A9Q1JG19_9CARY|nr:hypothetical protein Cgig2_009447 [Carnegiea gigantea]